MLPRSFLRTPTRTAWALIALFFAATPKKKPPKPKRDRGAERVRAHRAHRERLSEEAESKWEEAGHARRHAYMEGIRRALLAEGFRSSPFQWRHKGHAFGLIKDLGDKQVHVRVYENGVIDAEVEIHKRYVEHLISPRPSAHKEIAAILSKHGIPTDLVNEKYLPQVGARRKLYPKTRTKVSSVLGSFAGVAASVAAISVARMILRRKGRVL